MPYENVWCESLSNKVCVVLCLQLWIPETTTFLNSASSTEEGELALPTRWTNSDILFILLSGNTHSKGKGSPNFLQLLSGSFFFLKYTLGNCLGGHGEWLNRPEFHIWGALNSLQWSDYPQGPGCLWKPIHNYLHTTAWDLLQHQGDFPGWCSPLNIELNTLKDKLLLQVWHQGRIHLEGCQKHKNSITKWLQTLNLRVTERF